MLEAEPLNDSQASFARFLVLRKMRCIVDREVEAPKKTVHGVEDDGEAVEDERQDEDERKAGLGHLDDHAVAFSHRLNGIPRAAAHSYSSSLYGAKKASSA